MEYKNYLGNMFRFQGRSRRRDYWVVWLTNHAILGLLCTGAVYFYNRNHGIMAKTFSPMVESMKTILVVLSVVWFLFQFVSTWALTVRRFHDIGLPGWVYVICLAGYLACGLGFLVQVVLCLIPSRANNKFGEKPERNAKSGNRNIIVAGILFVVSLIVSVIYSFNALMLGIDKIKFGKMSGVTTNCQVYSVDGMNGACNYICKNDSDRYVYHKNAIYKLDTMEEVIPAENLIGMACNDELLYYATKENQGTLYCYDLVEGTNTMVTDAYKIIEMTAHGDDIFVLMTEKGNNNRGEWGAERGYRYDVIYYHKKEEGINLNEWASTQDEKESEDIYKIYSFAGYDVVEDTTIEGEMPCIVYVGQEDGFGYSCYGYNTYGKIDEEYVRCGYDGIIRHRGMDCGTELNLSEPYSGMTPSLIGFYSDQAWILEQYSRGIFGFRENPYREMKVEDIIYRYDPELEEMAMVYASGDREQIVGFSHAKNCVYLLRNNGVYRRDLATSEEELVFENDGYSGERFDETITFEYLEDTLYIFREPYRDPDTSEDMPEELVFVEGEE